MAVNFCTQCGSPLEGEGLLFCTRCGASLTESDGAYADTGAAAHSSMAAGYTVPADMYQRGGFATPQHVYQGSVPATVPAQGANRAAGSGAVRDDSDGSIVKKGAIIGVAIGLLIALVVVFVVYRPLGQSANGGQNEQGDTEITIPEENPDADQVVEKPEAEPATDYYDDLMSYYDGMAGYDARIADCATYFNNNYTKSDYGVRQSGADDAAWIQDDVNADLAALQELNVPSDNPYYDDWQHMIELMTDLQHRIDVIDQAWQNSLSYSDPANHVDTIIAPLSADNVDGVNRYKAHFQDNYGNWAPTRRL